MLPTQFRSCTTKAFYGPNPCGYDFFLALKYTYKLLDSSNDTRPPLPNTTMPDLGFLGLSPPGLNL